jgi:uroporphyrinogen decarboxylase
MGLRIFDRQIAPDWQELLQCLARTARVKRVHFFELLIDQEVQDRICSSFGLYEGLFESDPFVKFKKQIRLQRFLGYDYVYCGLEGMQMQFTRHLIDDTAELHRTGGRRFIDEKYGPIKDWDSFETYPWPDPEHANTRALEWYDKHLPDDMCLIALGFFSNFSEYLMWLMGYESLCYALYDKLDLVEAIIDRLTEIFYKTAHRLLGFPRIKALIGSDDMGFRSGTFMRPDDMRKFILPGHKLIAEMCHRKGKMYLLHSCGDISSLMEDLISDVKIDAKHSFEDTIESISDANKCYGGRISLLGGIDMDFLCRADEDQVRARVRKTLDLFPSGNGYCLGTGNSVTNYIPLSNYLAMLDEGRKYSG